MVEGNLTCPYSRYVCRCRAKWNLRSVGVWCRQQALSQNLRSDAMNFDRDDGIEPGLFIMDTSEHKEFRERMRVLLASFTQELPERISEIETLGNRLQTDWDTKALQELHRSVHNLVSNGKTFGYPELSGEARALERVLKSLLHDKRLADSAQLSQISQQILELKRLSIEKEAVITSDMAVVADDNAFLPDPEGSNMRL